jgi:hypothetical protein
MGNRIIRTLERLEENQRVAQEQARVAQEQARVAQEQARVAQELLLARLELLMTSTFEVVLRDHNAYDLMSETGATSAKIAKDNYMDHFSLNDNNVKCALTGLRGKITMAHILPRRTKNFIRKNLCLAQTDMDSHRNLVFLCANIEKAFDAMKISFVPQDVLHDALIMKIWDESVRRDPIFDGSTKKIGEFEHRALNFSVVGSDSMTREYAPFRRCFAYQALMCFFHHSVLGEEPPRAGRGSGDFPEYDDLRKRLLDMHATFLRKVKTEIEEEEEEEEEEFLH